MSSVLTKKVAKVSRRLRARAVLAAWLVCSSAPAAEPVVWNDDWPRFRLLEGVAAAALTGAFVANTLWLEQNKDGPRGGVLIDDAVVDALTVSDRDARYQLVSTGDMAFYALFAYPVIDVGIAWGARGSGDVAMQMLLIDWQSFALSGAIATLTQKRVGRRRPYVDDCATDPDYDPACGDDVQDGQSFVSGHTLAAFTGAGLTCVHHQHLELYGGLGDPVACVGALAAATWVATSRITTKNHYFSDVFVGAAVGIGSGYLLPSLLHYGFGGAAPARQRTWLLTPYGNGTHLGLGVLGLL